MVTDILSNATSIALLDCLISFSKVSLKNNYVRPEIDESINEIMIEGGRHPVVENMLGANKFIDNDTLLDNSENNILIITGPNMGVSQRICVRLRLSPLWRTRDVLFQHGGHASH